MTRARFASPLVRLSRLAVAMLPFVVAVGLMAQTAARSLSGTVTDRQHEPLRGAIVQLHNGATDSVVSYLTDRSGQYSFKRIDGNADYTVWATYKGTRSKTESISKFDSGATRVINLTITLP